MSRSRAFLSRSGNSSPVRSITAIRLSSVSSCLRVRYWTPELAAIKSGTISSDRMNDFVLTAARYSRTAMVSALRMVLLFRIDPGNADENVVQRRPSQLKVSHLAALHERCQDLLRVGATLQAQLLEAAE